MPTYNPAMQKAATAAKYIGEQVAAVVAATGTSDDPQGYGQTVARDLFPDVLPYVVGTPPVYGFAARNGRTLADSARGHAVPGHQHHRPLRAHPGRSQGPANRQLPLRRASLTSCAWAINLGHMALLDLDPDQLLSTMCSRASSARGPTWPYAVWCRCWPPSWRRHAGGGPSRVPYLKATTSGPA
jgi:hypothetical protein